LRKPPLTSRDKAIEPATAFGHRRFGAMLAGDRSAAELGPRGIPPEAAVFT